MNKVKVSVIIPTHNEEKLLPICLKSLKNQSTKFPFEIIVVDYISKDKTKEIAKQYKAKIIAEKKAGRAVARQHGAEIAKGDILAFTEADCRINSKWIDRMCKYMNKHSDVIGLTGTYTFYNSTPILNLLAKLILNFNEFFYSLFFRSNSFRGTNMIIRKEILKKVGGFNHNSAPCDDVDLGLRARKFGKIKFLPGLNIETSDRRIRGRFLKFIWEFISTYSRVFIFRKRGFDTSYEIIR